MSAPAKAGKLTALETLEELKRSFAGEALRCPRYVYLGGYAEKALIDCLLAIYPPGQLKRLANIGTNGRPERLITVAGLQVCRNPRLPLYGMVVTQEQFW